jgi:hypothetical protein
MFHFSRFCTFHRFAACVRPSSEEYLLSVSGNTMQIEFRLMEATPNRHVSSLGGQLNQHSLHIEMKIKGAVLLSLLMNLEMTQTSK